MDLEIANKIVLISGSSQGIGFSIAQSFIAEGAFVILNGRNTEKLRSAASLLGPQARFFPADVTQSDQCEGLMSFVKNEFKRLDILVCNVGDGKSVPPGEENGPEWERVFQTNFFSATNLIEASRCLLRESQGVILCVSSICGEESFGAPLTYSCAKSALNMYTRGMATPLAREGIRINAILPGNILCEGGRWEEKLREDKKSVLSYLKTNVPLNRFGKGEDVGALSAFLCSPRAAFMTGSLFIADGGQLSS